MRDAWDRRVRTDYRYWMSDGVDSDEHMWNTGRRDFAILSKVLPEEFLSQARGLEFGCGVGRLMRAAAENLRFVHGVDVSTEAISQARGLLADLDNVVIEPAEKGLADLPNDSFDFVYSFAVLGHLPTEILGQQLCEINRVLRVNTYASLQIYLGPLQDTLVEDSLVIRSYPEAKLRSCLEKAGFALESLDELKLPFEARDLENDRTPYIATLRKVSLPNSSAAELAAELSPEGEARAEESWQGSEFEYQMAVTRVHQLIAEKKFLEAEAVLSLAVEQYAGAEDAAHDVLRELRVTIKALDLSK